MKKNSAYKSISTDNFDSFGYTIRSKKPSGKPNTGRHSVSPEELNACVMESKSYRFFENQWKSGGVSYPFSFA